MKKWVLIGASALTVFLAAVWYLGNSDSTGVPKSVSRVTLDSLINVHGSPEQGLEVCGVRFRRIKGGPPYFIHVPSTEYVLFAYVPSAGERTLVLCNTNTCEIHEIPLEGVRFGERIGYWAATGGKSGDTVEGVESNRVTLLSKSFSYIERSVLDLSNTTIKVIELKDDSVQLQFNVWSNRPTESNIPSVEID